MSKVVKRGDGRWTALVCSKETRDLLRGLKKKDFGAEETWDHFLRRIAGLPDLPRGEVRV
jgi:hypothetical protein